MSEFRDPIIGTLIEESIQTQREHRWADIWTAFATVSESSSPTSLCDKLCLALNTAGLGVDGAHPDLPFCRHAPDTYLPDHVLLTSAIAYCLAYDGVGEDDLVLVRLAALIHEFPAPARQQLVNRLVGVNDADKAWLVQASQQLAGMGEALVDTSLQVWAEATPWDNAIRDKVLWQAHLAAADPLANDTLQQSNGQWLKIVKQRSDFDGHPLKRFGGQIGLVLGGATKIKGYVFESAKLPDIRGASVLLDRINQQDCRILFGASTLAHQQTAPVIIHAPECVIYANGGDILALTPPTKAQEIADAIEQRYAAETLTAQSVAVANQYDLLELQYGLRPTVSWADDYDAQMKAGGEAISLLAEYYGEPEKEKESALVLFYRRKGFGELATELALKRFWRREGNEGRWRDHAALGQRALAHFETLPYGQRCTSCDRRVAVVSVQKTNDVLCEPCLRKRSLGWLTRDLGKDVERLLEPITTWRPGDPTPWTEVFRLYLNAHPDLEQLYWDKSDETPLHRIFSPVDLGEIGHASDPSGFIGVVYADGNNVGAIIERIRTAGFYRQFAGRLFEATQAAVFTAIAEEMHPIQVVDDEDETVTIHPFEIVSIGGDDLFLIVPANKALPIALRIAEHMEEIFSSPDAAYRQQAVNVQRYRPDDFQPLGSPEISLSAGVVIAADNNPIFFLTDLVEELLGAAKRGAKDRKALGYRGGTVDFMALKSVTMVTTSVSEFRSTALRDAAPRVEGGCEVFHLTARPYTLHELDGLLKTAATLKAVSFPRSQLYHLRQLLPKGRFAATVNYLYYTSRLSPKHVEQLRSSLDDAWHMAKEPVPWRLRTTSRKAGESSEAPVDQWETVLADLVEILDFVPRPDSEATELATDGQ